MSVFNDITSKVGLTLHVERNSSCELQILYFYDPDSPTCAQLTPLFADIVKQYQDSSPQSICFGSINAKALPDITEEYGISSIPCVHSKRSNGRTVALSGSNHASICATLDRHIKAILKALAKPQPDPAAKAPELRAFQVSAPADSEQPKLFDRLSALVKSVPVLVFMKGTAQVPLCRFSRRLVKVLQEHDVEFGFFNILEDEEIRQGLKDFADWPTFPQLWVNGELVGGLDVVSISLLLRWEARL